MTTLILYIAICYLFAIGIAVAEFNKDQAIDKYSVICIIFSPILLPIFLGMDYYDNVINK